MKTKLRFIAVGAASIFILSASNKDSSDEAPTSESSGPGIGTPGGILLQIELPDELSEGNNYSASRIPNLLPEAKKFPEYRVPKGTVLLSRGKKVTSSDDFPIINKPALVTDGKKNGGEGYFLELLDSTQWVQIDLRKSAPLYAIVTWHYHHQLRVYYDVIIQVSDDPAFKTGVTTLYNNDCDNSSGMGKGADRPYLETRFGLLVNGKGTKARYVRLYSRGNSANMMNHYQEVEVYGIPE